MESISFFNKVWEKREARSIHICWALNKEASGTIFIPSLVWRGQGSNPWPLAYETNALTTEPRLIFLQVLFENGVNGILADEMGLGKTIQCVALVCQIITMGAKGPFMVIAPLSTLPNWRNEFRRFAPRVSGTTFCTFCVTLSKTRRIRRDHFVCLPIIKT